ncbi:AraC family transcriptional regulator [Paenibacillus filicis]|uniref:AraC family transcriptional regulator n=1 Tax=Paenibacillus filicis TaxID=669464 RepID=A0ABU9DG40_9BACL
MNRTSRFKLASSSLFVKLMLSFLSVILLLAAFNLFSYIYLRNKLYNEIIRYNELGIKQTVENYENHFRLTQNMILSLTRTDKWIPNISILSHVKENRRYDKINEVKTDLTTLYTNPFLHFDNFILYFKDDGYVVEKEGTSSAEDMFTKYYSSEAYPFDFWKGMSTDNYSLKILPTAVFTEKSMNSVRSIGSQMPLVIKAAPYENVYFIIMMNPQKLFAAYAGAGNTPFYIMDQEGRTLFASHDSAEAQLPASYQEGKHHELNGDFFYFYEKGADTGLTYVRAAPIATITSEMLKLNIWLVTLLVAAILISVVTSVVLSLRLNRPLRLMIETLERKQAEALPTSNIKEFAIISDRMSSMMKTNERIRLDLDKKNTLVRQYAYTNKVKNIPMSLYLTELEDAVQLDQPYAAVLYEINFKDPSLNYDQEIQLLRKLIHSIFNTADDQIVTLQIEQNQLMSLIFNPSSRDEILGTLGTLKQLLLADDYLYLTIAVSPLYTEEMPFTDAYEQLSLLLKEKRLVGETQIIVEPRMISWKAFSWKMTQKEELHTRLLTGSEESVLEWTDRHVDQLVQKDAASEVFQTFARGVVEEVEKTLVKLNLQKQAETRKRSSLDRLGQFYSSEQYKSWFRELLRPALAAIRTHSKTKDPITSFVTEYLDQHLCEDINLDLVADKLNITPGYLSSYFKEKTGTNFSDYLNDLRISRAKELLTNVELRIQDIAVHVGYQNVNSFIRMFKRYSGITPGEYRKRSLGSS